MGSRASRAAQAIRAGGPGLWFSLFVAALAFRSLTAMALDNPGVFDAYGYTRVAENMIQGRGMVEDFVWNYLDPRPIARLLPHPSHLYWMPGSTWFAWLGMRCFGSWMSSFAAAQIPFVVGSALLACASALLAWRLHDSLPLALQTWAVALFAPSFFANSVVPESCTPFALASTAALFVFGSRSKHWLPWIAGGACAGLAHLCRADGFLVAFAGLLTVVVVSSRRGGDDLRPVTAACALVLGYVAVMTPWWLRQVAVAGSILPGGGQKTMFFRDYDDIFAFDTTIDARHLFQDGPLAVVMGRLRAVGRNAVDLLTRFQVVLIPFAVLGMVSLPSSRRRLVLAPAIYAVSLFGFMTLVTPEPAQYGSLYHSSAALVPWVAILAPLGASRAGRWYAGFRGHEPGLAEQFVSWGTVAAMVVSAGYYLTCELRGLPSDALLPEARRLTHYRAIGAFLDARKVVGPILTTNPPAFTFASGRPSVVTPSDGAEAAIHAADSFGAQYLILEGNLTWALPFWRSASPMPGWQHVRTWANGLGSPARLYVRVATPATKMPHAATPEEG